jgi:hypothetical protein
LRVLPERLAEAVGIENLNIWHCLSSLCFPFSGVWIGEASIFACPLRLPTLRGRCAFPSVGPVT